MNILLIFNKINLKIIELINCERVVNIIYMNIYMFNIHFSFEFMCLYFPSWRLFFQKKKKNNLKYIIQIKFIYIKYKKYKL
jgi:hypothetical protein